MFGLDWRIAALLVMLLLGIYSVALKKFFNSGADWRVFLPLVGLVGIVALAYFAYSYKEIKFTNDAVVLGGITAVSIGLVTLFSMLVYADPETQLNVAFPIMSLAMVSTAALSLVFLGEQLSIKMIAGIALAVVSIIVLSWK